MGDYTTEALVEGESGITISTTTTPNSTQVTTYINEVEGEMKARGLDERYVVNIDMDVDQYPRSQSGILGVGGEEEYIRTEALIIVPPLRPIGVVSELKVRDTGLDETPTYTTLIEGPASNADFVVLQAPTMHGTMRGYAFMIFNTLPELGVKRIRGSFWWGNKLNSNWLQRYATLKVAEKVLKAKMGSAEPSGTPMFTGVDLQTAMPLDYIQRLRVIRDEINKMESDLPKYWSSGTQPF